MIFWQQICLRIIDFKESSIWVCATDGEGDGRAILTATLISPKFQNCTKEIYVAFSKYRNKSLAYGYGAFIILLRVQMFLRDKARSLYGNSCHDC